ncbi:MAG: 1,4-dihydroxy-2-naphthoate polyprenyltransferase [Melioribacteraceae bacterium]|nr:1,4-dihydroxy-2-naphthoate polyprenyltransferase [Melioribacteraceae bacterium]
MDNSDNKSNKFRSWILAARPKTLPAAVVPVLLGTAVAISDNKFQPLAAFIALICSVLIQVGTNFVNDLYDYLKGSDKKDRVGPARVLASGLISVIEMKVGIFLCFSVTFFLGLYLVYLGGMIILLIGILSIFFGYAYTAGPYPLSYNGLGDVFVFVFFGFVGTIGTYYVQALDVSWVAVLVSIPAGALITNILVVNNYRDIEEDRVNNKKTLAVLFGKRYSRFQYYSSLIISYAVPIIIYFNYKQSILILLPLITLPLALRLVKMMLTYKGNQLNETLALTAKFSALFAILLSIGIAL